MGLHFPKMNLASSEISLTSIPVLFLIISAVSSLDNKHSLVLLSALAANKVLDFATFVFIPSRGSLNIDSEPPFLNTSRNFSQALLNSEFDIIWSNSSKDKFCFFAFEESLGFSPSFIKLNIKLKQIIKIKNSQK